MGRSVGKAGAGAGTGVAAWVPEAAALPRGPRSPQPGDGPAAARGSSLDQEMVVKNVSQRQKTTQ